MLNSDSSRYEPCCTPDGKLSLPKDEWLSVLKLTTSWKFNSFRKMAIESLTPQLGIVEKIELGHEFYVLSWVVSGYREFIARPAHPTTEEGRKLGFEKVMTLWGIRDSHKAFGFPTIRTADSIIEEKIYASFESELDELHKLEHPHLTSYDKRLATSAKQQRERLRSKALLEEEHERDRRLQDADRRKRRRKERSVSMNSKQQEELLPSIRPTHSLPTRPMRQQRSAHHDQVNGFRYPQPHSNHRSIPELPQHPPPLTPPKAIKVLPDSPPSEGDTCSPNSPASPPCTPPRPVRAPAPLTPFFTPTSSPLQPASNNSGNGNETPLSDRAPRAWAWESLRFDFLAKPNLVVAPNVRSLAESIFTWASEKHYRLVMRYCSSSIGAFDLPRVATTEH